MKKILHIVLLADMSGSKQVMIDIMNKLDSKYDKYVMSNGEGELIDYLAHKNIKSIAIKTLCRNISISSDIKTFISMYKIIKKNKFDIVHTHSSKTGLLGRVAAKLAGVKLIVHHVHGYAFHEQSSFLSKTIYGTLEYIASFFCNYIIFVNNEEREWSMKKFKFVNKLKLITIYNGVDKITKRICQAEKLKLKEELNITSSNVCLFVGRLEEQKNPLGLINIIDKYYSLYDNDISFIIVGDGSFRQKMEGFLSGKKYSKNVLFTGWINSVDNYYKISDIFLLPSLWEGLPKTIVEAMSYGLPIIASNIKGNREAVKDGLTGFLVNPDDIDSFAEKINLTLKENIYNTMVEENYKFINEKFMNNKNMQDIVNIYKRIENKS